MTESIPPVNPIMNRFQYRTIATHNGEATKYITRKYTENEGRVSSVTDSTVIVYNRVGNLKTIPSNTPTIIKYV